MPYALCKAIKLYAEFTSDLNLLKLLMRFQELCLFINKEQNILMKKIGIKINLKLLDTTAIR